MAQAYYDERGFVTRVDTGPVDEHAPGPWALAPDFADCSDGYVQHGQWQPYPPEVAERCRQRPPGASHWCMDTWQWQMSEQGLWQQVRQRRQALLQACDWVVLRANELGQAVPPDWLAYRQALRDVTLQSNPAAIVWPQPPEGAGR